MQRLLTVLFLLFPVLLEAQEDSVAVIDSKKAAKDASAMSLLPAGSVLDGVMLPRYDEDRKLVDVMKAARMTIMEANQVAGENITIEFYNPDESLRGRVEMVSAIFNQTTGILRAEQPVDINTDRVLAHGTGLYYSLKTGKGFLLGPASTRIINPPATAMNVPTPLRVPALLGISMLPVFAAQLPVEAPAEEAAEIKSAATNVSEGNKETREKLRADLERSAAATQEVVKFLEEAELLAEQPAPTTLRPEPKPLDIKTGPDDTVVNCDGGMYLDSEAGHLVYLRNVVVTDPRFDLSGADELKIFFEKKPVDPAKDPKAPAKDPKTPADTTKPGADKTAQKPAKDKAFSMGGTSGGLGEVEKLIATGAVRILQKAPGPGKQPIEASGSLFIYNVKTGEIVISGGYPWVKQGTYYSRAKRPSETLRIFKDGSFKTEGFWEMGGPLDMKK